MLWTQWYFILLYLIVVVVILVVVAVVVWFIVRERWSILIRERKVVKEKVKKSESKKKGMRINSTIMSFTHVACITHSQSRGPGRFRYGKF